MVKLSDVFESSTWTLLYGGEWRSVQDAEVAVLGYGGRVAVAPRLLPLHQDVRHRRAGLVQPRRRVLQPPAQQLRRRVAQRGLVQVGEARDLNLVLGRRPVTLGDTAILEWIEQMNIYHCHSLTTLTCLLKLSFTGRLNGLFNITLKYLQIYILHFRLNLLGYVN